MKTEDFLSSGMHIGMKQQTKDMKRFIYKIRDDGLAILDLKKIQERIEIAANYLSKLERILVVSRKPTAKKAIEEFAKAVGGKAVAGRFLPGTITNPSFKEYYEPEVVIVTDPYIDKQAVKEAVKMRIPIVALCDTFNETSLIDLVIPVNNKGRKALAMTFYMLATEILKKRGKETKLNYEDFEVKKKAK
ncbi:MAG: 30S ribosomal protein S2 [Candidatus Aenigmarchaeota archaeon]|nr:30S ribosomal protein S2 [Candidatus Aenigmarchaeota archaeon]